MKELARTEFGNPILRTVSKKLTKDKINSKKIQNLIRDMRFTLTSKKLGVGLAAPQVGEDIALSVISIHPTKHRPKVAVLELVIINPKITKLVGRRTQMWEGCLSGGKSGLFAKVPRHNSVELVYLDEKGVRHKKFFNGLPAQVIQHEVDHLNGILFVDRVKDTKTYMTLKEYKKRIAKQRVE
jgi:peptide deformylase